MDTDTKIRRAHIALMRHPETCLYAGVFLMGKTTVVDNIPTACTDGVNTMYGKAFIDSLPEKQIRAVVLHENLHKALRQLMRGRGLMKEDGALANAAMDYVVNNIINDLQDKELAELPSFALQEPRFRNWSMVQVYDYLKTGNPPPPPPKGKPGDKSDGGGQGKPLPKGKPQRGPDGVTIGDETFPVGGLDQHDLKSIIEGLNPDEMRKLDQQIADALRQGGLLAGRTGAKVPRVIKESLVREINWRDEMRDFVTASTVGRDEYTYRKYNRRWLADDIYLPSTEDETVGEVIVAIDTSGSIGNEELGRFASHLANICQMTRPEKVRVLWWDTHVHGEQVFNQGNYQTIAALLKPQGGGGTHAGCVRDYLVTKKVTADCIVMFTDGYIESQVNWQGLACPTLWLITQNMQCSIPEGHRKVRMQSDQE